MQQILFRKIPDLFKEEIEAATEYFSCVYKRTDIFTLTSLAIPRYSSLPFYKELEEDLLNMGCYIINTYKQHSWIANFEWYYALKEFTFRTWDDHSFYQAPEGQYVVKGRTNSQKFRWNTHMFAKSKRQALEIAGELANDNLIGPQGIIYRAFEELEVLSSGINDLPFTNEWRFFFYKEHLLTFGYYWSNSEIIPNNNEIDPAAIVLAKEIADICKDYVNFFVLDIAKTKFGEWKLVEINDGTMSGLSECSPKELYSQLYFYLNK